MKYITAAIAALAFSSLSNANLITNGGFESPDINSGWTYQLDDLPGGWEGDNIEVWKTGFNGVNSFAGDQHGELNAHPNDGTNFSIFQTFNTVDQADYDFSFAYRARNNNSESFLLEIFTDTSDLFSMIFDDHTTSAWSTFSDVFLGTGELTTFRFTSINPNSGTVGNFLDAVTVEGEVASVPEPGSLALLAIGLIGLGISRKNIRA
ncbi:PEP-CTERM sorting domain-containing protein [Oceanicoccus sp. KOV_DT_Chl]|uniref:PEP-CTERM sorting domain-containing protein n=1 Tax=Oceanicoccus sp. KOV_DT_Chl TaxID=1904639 RepID=UPI000C7D7A3D|nr:PEP-CTERM sorting domain-containing protein [Oceanicoccus sp. KOV_DT_Chl]